MRPALLTRAIAAGQSIYCENLWLSAFPRRSNFIFKHRQPVSGTVWSQD